MTKDTTTPLDSSALQAEFANLNTMGLEFFNSILLWSGTLFLAYLTLQAFIAFATHKGW